ncbi:MAG: hypothetical protein M3R17_08130 [Bacteroidota bacterium]|nr:hypothetical protein [Bacteroidota bacterium]
MRLFLLIVLISAGLKVSCQTARAPIRERFIPEGTIPGVPYTNVVSFLVTTHSSSGTEIKIYNEAKISGQELPLCWCGLISKLPSGSFVLFSNIIAVQHGSACCDAGYKIHFYQELKVVDIHLKNVNEKSMNKVSH